MCAASIVVLTTGGTIASVRTESGAVPILGGVDLASRAGIDTAANVTVRELMSTDSSALSPVQMATIRDEVTSFLDDRRVTGVVVAHGTDTLEETAMMVDLVHADDRAVVFTGAQFTSDHPAADGPANLRAAVEVAGAHRWRGRGTLVAFGSKVLPARGVYKASTTDIDGFSTYTTALARPLLPAEPVDLSGITVDIITLYPGIDPGIVTMIIDRGRKRSGDHYGVILAGTGSGNTHPDIAAIVAEICATGTTVVVSSRVPFGEITAQYGGGGGAMDLLRAGALISGWLRPAQLRIVLLDLLARGYDAAAIADFVAACNTPLKL